MSEAETRVVQAACAEIAKFIGQENSNVRYELNFQKYNIRDEVLPATIPKLLEVLHDPQVNAEVIREVLARKLHNCETDQILSNLSLSDSTDSSQFTYSSQDTCNSTVTRPLITSKNSTNVISDSEKKRCENIPENLQCSKYIKIRKRYLAILAVGMLCGTIAASCLVTILVWLTTGDKDLSFMDGLQATCYPIVLLAHLVVRSLDEYNIFARKNQKPNAAVVIKIAEPSDWPIGIQIKNSDKVTDIFVTGPLHGNKLIELLSQTPTLHKLAISNDCNKICSETQQQIAQFSSNSIELPLKILILEKFKSSCSNLLDTLGDKLTLQILEEFIFDKGLINGNIMANIMKLLEKSKNTLKRLEFLNTTTSIELFGSESKLAFPSVTSVVYDIETSYISSISDEFCSKFPNLQHFSFGAGLREWAEISNIIDCKKLKTVNFKLKMPTEQTNFSLSFLSENFPRLESADITLDFPKCAGAGKYDNSIGNFILGRNTLSDLLLVNVGITSNCNLIHI